MHRLLRHFENLGSFGEGQSAEVEELDDLCLPRVLPGKTRDRLIESDDVQDDDNVYTFIFDGNSQVLDHFFVTDNLLGTAEFDIVHVNVDFPRISPAYGSDHEPLIGRFDLNR